MECTINRVQDQYHDQLERSGHYLRLDDIERFAELGIRTLRYPVLWERTAPDGLGSANWSWPDQQMARLRAMGIDVIIGLVHHGSGPRSTDLLDPAFPEKLASYARAVAQRYPWVTAFTPVNEPLTTARFSGLYGHWYPHGRDDRLFVQALLTQCRAVSAAMQAIRSVTPNARLVQTEDLGVTFSTPPLLYQARFENERRWLSFDLLCGLVTPDHPLWSYLIASDASEPSLRSFMEYPCPPDVVGVNHYITSQRFLDHRLERYPASTHGGNGRQRYADVEAVRVREEGFMSISELISAVWQRYRLPVAVTEAHLGCTREQQMRWLLEIWRGAQAACDAGADIIAVTVWALLGSFDWDSLVTRDAGRYEPGVFDVRGPCPRPTALAGMVRALAAGVPPCHPVLEGEGWWHRPERFLYAPVATVRTA